MDWTDVIVTISSRDVEEASAIAQMTVDRGIYIEDYSDLEENLKRFGPLELIDDKLLQKDQGTAHIHVYLSPEEIPAEAMAFLREQLQAAGIVNQLKTQHIAEEDWANNWKQYFKPCAVGKRLRIVPSWERENAPRDERKNLILDPGMAFGSGQHETTRLCMELLEEGITADTTMLDVGTGSGILSIAALLLDAKSVVGVDIDPLSVKIAKENAERNGVSERYTVLCGDLAQQVSGTFQMITANIVADVILRLLPDAFRLLKKGGLFIASGIIDTREEEVLAAMKRTGLSIQQCKRERGWCAISAVREK